MPATTRLLPRKPTTSLFRQRCSPPWKKAGKPIAAGKTTWREAFGNDPYGEECFMAWHYACYVERLAQVARRIYNVPLYVNAAMNSRGRKPGEYPSAGPLAHLATIWKCGAPSIDMLSHDIYDTGFKSWASQYAFEGNPLFIPETRCCENSGARALYTFGEYDAVGFSPFAIDQYADPSNITNAYALLRQMHNYVSHNTQSSKSKVQSSKTTWGLLFDQEDKERIITDGDHVLTCRHNFHLALGPSRHRRFHMARRRGIHLEDSAYGIPHRRPGNSN